MKRFIIWSTICLTVLVAWALFVGYVIEPSNEIAILLGFPVGVPVGHLLLSVWTDEFA